MMEHVIPHHLIHQVDSFHVLLVGLEHCRHRNSFSLSTCSSSRHKAHLLWGVVIRQGKYRLCVDPDAVGDVVILCRAELVTSQLDDLGEQCHRKSLPIRPHGATSVKPYRQQVLQQLHRRVEVVHEYCRMRATQVPDQVHHNSM